jgi:iron(III) transport system substrate-binding protein
VCLAISSVVSACGDGDDHTITVYNGQHAQLTQSLVAEFQKQTGITVKLRTNDSIVLAQQIVQEGGKTPADVYISENSPELILLEKKNLLDSLPSSTLSQIPSKYNSPSGKWVAMAARVSCLVYNPAKISQSRLPRTVTQLAEKFWKGKIAIAPGDSDFVPVVSAVIATEGTEGAKAWLEGLKSNADRYQDLEGVLNAVNNGDVPMGMINSYYWFRLQLEVGEKGMHSRIFYFPGQDPGGVENVGGAAVVAGSSHQADARKFVDFLVSQKGQTILAGGDDFEYPLRAGVAPDRHLPPLTEIDPTFLGISRLGDDQAAARLLQQVGLE